MQKTDKDTSASINDIVREYQNSGIDSQIDFGKIHLYSIIAHSTAIEGSTITEEENHTLFEEGVTIQGKPLVFQMMNLDLKEAYEEALKYAADKQPVTEDSVKRLAALVMRRTGSVYHSALGNYDASRGDLRLGNVTAGPGGKSYLSFQKVPDHFKRFCQWLEQGRKKLGGMDPESIYRFSFEAHLRLVTIHPWADGNGRTSRLVMNYMQIEGGVIPTIIRKEDKPEYIRSLKESQDKESTEPFMNFMMSLQKKNLLTDIAGYKESMQKEISFDSLRHKQNKSNTPKR